MIKSPATTANSPPHVGAHAGPPGAVAPLPGFVPAKTHYPMFVMPVPTFMEFDGLLPDHQTMLQRGDLVPHDPETMKDLTMFISHQCTFTAFTPLPSGRCCRPLVRSFCAPYEAVKLSSQMPHPS